MHDIGLEVLTLQGNELSLFRRTFSRLVLIMSTFDLAAVGINFNVFSYDTVWGRASNPKPSNVEGMHYMLCHLSNRTTIVCKIEVKYCNVFCSYVVCVIFKPKTSLPANKRIRYILLNNRYLCKFLCFSFPFCIIFQPVCCFSIIFYVSHTHTHT